jgi:hypothetical protein
MKLIRIGEKIINRERLYRLVDNILVLRANGATQQDVANTLDLERPFISNLERLGEVRVGRRVAMVGFSIINQKDVKSIARDWGIDSVHLFNGEMLSKFISKAEVDERGILKRLLKALSGLRNFDLLIFLGQGNEGRLLEKTLGVQVLNVPVHSKSESGVFVDITELEEHLQDLVSDEGGNRAERSSERKFRFFKKGSRGKNKSLGRGV